MQAIILAIGDELVLGQTVDTNSSYLSDQLVRRGVGTLYHQVVADDAPAVTEAIRLAAARVELVIISGGLGPTEDDLTRQALAAALGVELVVDQPSLEHLVRYFSGRSRPMPEKNKVQALCPRGAAMIPNSCGTAPGIKAQLGRATIYVTPGVPGEMVAMFERSILPELDSLAPTRDTILTAKVNTFGLGESALAERLGNLMDRARNPKVGTTVAGGIVSVRVRSEFASAAQAQKEMDATLAAVEKAVGPTVFGCGEEMLQHAAVTLLKERGLTLATAESCTGGLLGKSITDVPGSSAVYVGGWVTYANAMKAAQLGVPPEMIEQYGAVSREVAQAMAAGALTRSSAAIAISVTGVAGPEGGTPEKPVGLVWVGLARSAQVTKRPSDQVTESDTRSLGHSVARSLSASIRLDLAWSRTREGIRDRAAKSALQLLRFWLLGVPLEEMTWGRR